MDPETLDDGEIDMLAEATATLAETVRRLMRERDEAREAARVLADALTRERDSYWSSYEQEMFLRARGYAR